MTNWVWSGNAAPGREAGKRRRIAGLRPAMGLMKTGRKSSTVHYLIVQSVGLLLLCIVVCYAL